MTCHAQPTLLGTIGFAAMRHLLFSAEQGLGRYRDFGANGLNPYADEELKRGAPATRRAAS